MFKVRAEDRMGRWVYQFNSQEAEGSSADKNLLGGKGANLAQMCSLGFPVPPGFTISTEVCDFYYKNGRSYPKDLEAQVAAALQKLGQLTGKYLGAEKSPLLLSVRSGARVSMPGMMDTILNLGLNDKTLESLASKSDARFAYDSYRRFIQMYSTVVLGLKHDLFEQIIEQKKQKLNYDSDLQLAAQDWKEIVASFQNLVKEQTGKPFPQDIEEQLWGAIGAVFSSWMTPRAIEYRRYHNIPEEWGTAVNIQAMVFGNMGEECATGVAFTRNPSTGGNELFGEFLVNAQGEDVVAGIRTPQNITARARKQAESELPSLEEVMPALFDELQKVARALEHHYRDMQDIEFTIENGKLWLLQTRSGKRTLKAALKIAVDMAKEHIISKEEAVLLLEPKLFDQLLHPTIDTHTPREILTTGLPASPGAAVGKIVFTPEDAQRLKESGQKALLVRTETSPEDIHGMLAAEGIVTCRGGMTSHAAVVARGMGKPCVCGASALHIDHAEEKLFINELVFSKGEVLTVDGSTGEILKGEVPLSPPEFSEDFTELMQWANSFSRLQVRANAETVRDAEVAHFFGAQGIGLCRTEHMFFLAERISCMREMILASDAEGRKKALAKLAPMQRGDFLELFKVMEGLPVTIRLLDPPLHEFLPKTAEEINNLAHSMGVASKVLYKRLEELHEVNPMLGLRGCRLAIIYPEIVEMQASAIFGAAVEAAKITKKPVKVEIMVPLVMSKQEFTFVREKIEKVAQELFSRHNTSVPYTIGTMIELPRAALLADQIAEGAEFFSFGTNDLTQTTYGISRDDCRGFLTDYIEKGLLQRDPFAHLDQEGVGALIACAVTKGRTTNAALKLGICGEHGGDPESIAFCEKLGLDYVSCSPFRVPIARLAAAQAALRSKA